MRTHRVLLFRSCIVLLFSPLPVYAIQKESVKSFAKGVAWSSAGMALGYIAGMYVDKPISGAVVGFVAGAACGYYVSGSNKWQRRWFGF